MTETPTPVPATAPLADDAVKRIALAILRAQLDRETDSQKPTGWEDAHPDDHAEAFALARAAIEAGCPTTALSERTRERDAVRREALDVTYEYIETFIAGARFGGLTERANAVQELLGLLRSLDKRESRALADKSE